MCIDTLSAFIGRVRSNALPRRPAILLVVFGLLSGCSLAPELAIKDDEGVLPVGDSQAQYNKPYKIKGKTYSPLRSASGYKARGMASWYGAESGNRTASGVRFNPHGFTAAHKTLPIPSKVRVTNLRNGRYVDVIINDRGPFKSNRLIDLSQGAAEQIGMGGLAEVKVEYLES